MNTFGDSLLSERFNVLCKECGKNAFSTSPILFLIVLNDVLKTAVEERELHGIHWGLLNKLSHLNYADDIYFLSHKNSGRVLSTEGARASLRINTAKTKQILNKPERNPFEIDDKSTEILLFVQYNLSRSIKHELHMESIIWQSNIPYALNMEYPKET